jgi:putative membrane protein
MHLLLRWIINAGALMLLPYVITSIRVDNFVAALVAALFIGLVNAVIRPIAILITLPINILTLGLFTLVINALLFWLVGSFVKGFYVESFWAAFFGALLYSLITYAVGALIFKREQ